MIMSIILFSSLTVGLILSVCSVYPWVYAENADKFFEIGKTLLAKDPFYQSINGTITLNKSLNAEGMPQNEISFIENSLINGNISAVNQGTFIDTIHPNNFIVGKGQGIITSSDGQQVTWNAEDIGKITNNGSTIYQGLIYFDTKSNGSLDFLKGSVGLYICMVENDGSQRNIWEWKIK